MQPEKFKKTEEIQKSDEALNELELTEVSGGKQAEDVYDTNGFCPENGYCPKKPKQKEQQ